MCGEPKDEFLSQGAIFRRQLDSMGGDYAAARLLFSLGTSDPGPLPARWKPYFSGIDVRHPDPEDHQRLGIDAQCHLLWDLLDPSADVSVICDADTLFLQPFPEVLLHEVVETQAVYGVIALYPPSIEHVGAPTLSGPISANELWPTLGERVIGRKPRTNHAYTLLRPSASCPFYINHGVIVGAPAVLRRLWEGTRRLLPRVQAVLENDFSEQIAIAFTDQIAIALAVEEVGLPARELPMRFNYPNDHAADVLYPDEMANAVIVHYMRRAAFDRHQIFHDEPAFNHFMRADLAGSDAMFRDHVRDLTGGKFPFP
jgi:hypothetical protein